MNEHLHQPNAAQLAEIEESCACLNVRKAARAITQLFDEVLQPTGLRSTQFPLLVTVALLGEAPVTQLAEELVMDRTTLARNLKPLESQGLLTQGDQAAFAGYCSAWARWVRFERLVQREKAADVAIGQGYANAATKALHQLTQLLARFGLSPSDRNQVAAVPPRPPGQQTKLGSFLAGAKAGGADA